MKDGKMTRSEAGRLGAEKVKVRNAEKYRQRISEYEKNPTKCKACDEPLPYKRRHDTFCSQSCSATHNNKGVRRHGNEPTLCLNCGKRTKKYGMRFCSNSCPQEYQHKEYIKDWLAGRVSGNRVGGETVSSHIKRWLRETRGKRCEICGTTIWCGESVPLLMDHIDGDWKRTVPDNLRLVCGNCDMQLPTYKNRNKGKGRFARRERYAQGKSY
jgi:hypothetical protein